MLTVCNANYFRLFDDYTDHMRAFQCFAKLQHPAAFVTEDQRPAFDATSPAFENVTPAEFFDALLGGEYHKIFPNLHKEKTQDLVDNGTFYTIPFSLHGEGS
jgi:hypothetical protein